MNAFPATSLFSASGPAAGRRLLAALVLVLCAARLATAAAVTLIPTEDTTLFETNPDANLGQSRLAAGTTVTGKRTRALLRFDPAGVLPANARVLEARLTLWVTRTPNSGGTDSTADLFRVLAGWGEGEKSGGSGEPATAGEATWNARFHPAILWSVPGGAPGADFAVPTSGSGVIGGEGTISSFTGAGLAEDVRTWLADPAGNFGWVLISRGEATNGTARRFGSRGDIFEQPRLELRYTVPEITNVALLDHQAVLRFPVESNLTYRVEAAGSPAAAVWSNVVELAPSPQAAERAVTNALPAWPWYFRLRIP